MELCDEELLFCRVGVLSESGGLFRPWLEAFPELYEAADASGLE